MKTPTTITMSLALMFAGVTLAGTAAGVSDEDCVVDVASAGCLEITLSRTGALCNGGTCTYTWDSKSVASGWGEPGSGSMSLSGVCSDFRPFSWLVSGTTELGGCADTYFIDGSCTTRAERLDGSATGSVSGATADPGPISSSFTECL